MRESEAALIRLLSEEFNKSFQRGVEVGIGDDAAVISKFSPKLVATVDMAVEDIHFRRDWSTPFQIGAKLTTASLADVFAMGGQPNYLLVALALSANENTQVITELAQGVRSVADRFDVIVIGGDLSKSEKMVLSITALGEMAANPIKRGGAKIGQKIYLSALPGLSAAGFSILTRSLDRPRYVVEAHLNPKLTKPEKLIQCATAMCDISDGLSTDALHIAQASNVDLNFSRDLISKASDFKDLSELARELNEEVFEWILNGGEDHFFIATVDPVIASEDLGIYVGMVEAGSGKVLLDGAEISSQGYQHF
jgi:thiamine-monophosphate kinase